LSSSKRLRLAPRAGHVGLATEHSGAVAVVGVQAPATSHFALLNSSLFRLGM
jgi:hypothetical protein